MSSGTQWWICGLDPGCRFPGSAITEVHRVFTAMTARLLDVFAQGRAGQHYPAVDNVVQLGVPGARAAPPTPDMPAALVPD